MTPIRATTPEQTVSLLPQDNLRALELLACAEGHFAAQLGYLRDAGYYSISLEPWGEAIAHKQSLPGRAVILIFDDGYLDFLTYAYPIL